MNTKHPRRGMGCLVNTSVINEMLLPEAVWSDGHGAQDSYLGAGLLYYALVYATRAQRCVCIGSGGGFVPRLMRQAQRDLGGDGETHLVDANLPEAGWGAPEWLSAESFFRTRYPEVHIHLMKSEEAALHVFADGGIDYLHIDGDHSEAGVREDIETYLPLLSKQGIMTVHDTVLHLLDERAGVASALAGLRAEKKIEFVDFPFIGVGVAIVRKCQPQSSRFLRLLRFIAALTVIV